MKHPAFTRRPISQIQLLTLAQFCASEMGVAWKEVITPERMHAGIVWARQVSQFVCAECTGATMEQIAAVFHRDHSCIIYSLKKVKGYLDVYPQLVAEINTLKAKASKLPGTCGIAIIEKAA